MQANYNALDIIMKSRRSLINFLVKGGLLGIVFFIAVPGICAEEKKKTTVNKPPVTEQEYIVQPGDRLLISVWREEGLQQEVLVRPDGGLSFPLAGEIKGKGMTVAQLEKKIAKRLAKYIPEPTVTVSLAQNLGNRIYVMGKVTTPGEYVITRSIDVTQALAMAGGITPFADKDAIKILRRRHGKQHTFFFDYKQVERGENLKQNITLIPGDTVVVP